MQILKQACGPYETNCYILNTSKGDFIIDPGVNALSFIKQYAKKPLAILNTHGHYDHVWDNARVKKNLTFLFISIKMMNLCYKILLEKVLSQVKLMF